MAKIILKSGSLELSFWAMVELRRLMRIVHTATSEECQFNISFYSYLE